MADDDLKVELERLRNENAALKKGAATGVTMKVSEKGALSIYDPTTAKAAPDGRIVTNPFDNNTIPLSRMDPVALKIQALIPAPTPRRCGGRLFMIPVWLGDANRPIASPIRSRSAANAR